MVRRIVKRPPYRVEHVAVGVALFSAVVTLAALVISACHGAGSPPAYALESSAVWVLERAAVASLILIVPAMVIGQMLSGALPSSITRDGLVFREESSALGWEHQEALEELREEMTLLQQEVSER